MKMRRFLCYIFIFLFCSLASAQNKELAGIELCDDIHSFLKKNGFSPSAQSLVVSGENTFPYNIIVTFPPEEQTWPENLLLVFFQEDVAANKELIKESLKLIREAKYPFTVTALFAYGEKQKLQKADMIYGSKVFLENLNTNISYTAVIFDLEAKTCDIETTAGGLSSPPVLIRNALNLYKASGIGKGLPPFILSQISSYSFISSRILKDFFDSEIPAIKLSIGKLEAEKKSDICVKIISGLVEDFSKSADNTWEHHFLISSFFGSYHIISEGTILRIVTPTIFLWLLFIFILIFVNRRMKRHTWYTIGKIWWSVPLTYLLLVLCFSAGAYFFPNFFPNISDAGKIYGQLILQICFSLFITLAVYLLILTLNYNFNERAVDYLLVISCFINQSIFILADISLSPIFIVICLLSLLALTVKNNYLHIAVFLLMILPLIPYGHRMIGAADLSALSDFLASSKMTSLVIPLVLYPVYIVLFRIITSVRTNRKKTRYVITAASVSFVLISAALISLGIIRTSSLNKNQHKEPEITLSNLGEELISLTASDEEIFDDTIRTISISLKEDCLLCDLLLTTEDINPILYSDNDYINPSANTARFRIPDNPPKEMTFKYGAAKVPCHITLSAVIEGQQEGDYRFISRSLEIGEN